MTTYTAIANTEVDAGSPITTTLMQSMRDNPIAIAEGSTGAPVVAAGWHPYDMVTVGDGNDGVIYDSAVDGSVATVATPSFEDGYEYALKFEAIGAGSSGALQFSFYLDVAASYTAAQTISSTLNLATPSERPTGLLYIPLPRIPKYQQDTRWLIDLANASSGSVIASPPSHASGVLETIGGARINLTPATLSAGKIKLYRRREFITG